MKYKRLLFLGCFIIYALMAKADTQTLDGIFVTVSGSQTCYKLDEIPTVTYTESGGAKVAQIKLKSSEEPVVSVTLSGDATLEIIYGTYTPSGFDSVTTDVSITENNGKRIIKGGRLIIIGKDGKQYNINGTLIE